MLPNPGMSFTPFDVLPASDLNDIVENIEALSDGSGIESAAITAEKLISNAIAHGYVEIKSTVLGGAGDTITVSSIPTFKYLKFIISVVNTGGSVRALIRFNNDSGTTYANNEFENGTNSTNVSQANINLMSNSDNPFFSIVDVENIANKEKLVSIFTSRRGGAGAANAPAYKLVTGKWANTSDQISRVDLVNTSTGDYASTSEIRVMGKN